MTGRGPAAALLGGAAVVLAGATAGASAGLEPFATGYYHFAWISTLAALDATVALVDGRFFLLGRPAFAATLLGWSVPFWYVFELANLRLDNWSYVGALEDPLAGWGTTAIAFATVLAAILGSERLLDAFGLARGSRIRRLRVAPGLRRGLQAAGLLSLALCLAFPRTLFPLLWVGVALVVDPWVHRREPARSLLGDLERGRPGRIVRLLVGGLAIGVLWEIYNLPAGARWVYSVPGFEPLPPFEMPLAGFLGFPPFALEGFAVWQALVVAGAAVPREGPPRPAPRGARALVALAAVTLTIVAYAGVRQGTVASWRAVDRGGPGESTSLDKTIRVL